MADAKRSGRRGLVLSLCLSDLRHEWLLSLCMVMAVAAVLGPLLILFGLKFGAVEIMRGRLVDDPRNREIRPIISRSFSSQWLADIAARPDVTFIVPGTRQLAASVDLSRPGRKALSVDAIPTAPGDPLVLQNNNQPPGEGEVLLSAAAAEALEAGQGDTVTMLVKRVKGGGFESGSLDLRVAGVLPVRAGAARSIMIPLPLLEAVEQFKDGLGVSAFNWPGDLPRAYPAFSSLLVALPEAPGTELAFAMTSSTGFSSRREISPDQAAQLLPPKAAAAIRNHRLYLLSTKGTPAGVQNITAVRNLLAGQKAVLFPLASEVRLNLVSDQGQALGEFPLLPAAALDAPQSAERAAFPWKDDLRARKRSPESPLQLLVPARLAAKSSAVARVMAGDNILSFPVQLVPDQELDTQLAAPLSLLGILGLFQNRPLVFDSLSNEFLLARRGYSSFRLYAASLEQVAPLKRYLEEQGLQVHTEAERIDDVLRLDACLSLIFWLIAAGSLLGGAACLASNIYAGIERKRRDLAVLRLLGLSGSAFFRFPLYTAAFFALSGFAVAISLFLGMALVINTLFAEYLQAGESLCRLAWHHPLIALALTTALALSAGATAALRARKIEPAEALRDE